MNGKIDWNVFAYKFKDNPRVSFETLAYHMFCRTFGIAEGLPAFYNQKHIETNPIEFENGRIIGFQAKYYETPSINTTQKANMIKAIEGAANTYKGITELYFYLSRSFSQSSQDGENKTSAQLEIEETGKMHGIEIVWILPSQIEIILNRDNNADLWEYFFKPVDGLQKYPTCLTAIPPVDRTTFTGRTSIINELTDMLTSQGKTALISGVGGIGKTAVMQYIANAIMDNADASHAHVAWLDCGSSLEEDLLPLAKALNIPDDGDKTVVYQKIIHVLSVMDEPVFIFFDNMSRVTDTDEFKILNSRNLHLMFTSRHKIAGVPYKDLDVLSHDDAVEMFYRYYNQNECLDTDRRYEDVTREITRQVGRHTLLVELLAKAASMKDIATLDNFRDELGKKGFFDVSQDKLDVRHGDGEHTIEEHVMKLYEISGLNEDQKKIMHLFTIFPAELSIFGSVIEWAGYGEGSGDKRDGFKRLVKLGWINKVTGGYSIHQIVRDSVIRQMIAIDIEFSQYGKFLLQVIDTDAYISKKVDYINVRKRLIVPESVIRYFNTRKIRSIEAAGLYDNVAGVYEAQGDYKKALQYYSESLSISKELLGEEHSFIAKLFNNMAGVYFYLKDYQNALEYYSKAFSINEKVLGREHVAMAAVYNNIALIYEVNKDYKNALEYYSKALAIYEKVLGKEHPDIARILNNMAVVYYYMENYSKALEFDFRALIIREDILGKEHPDTATTYHNLAGVFKAQGKYEKAIEYFRKALYIREKILGKEHPDTGTTYNNMAEMFKILGNNEEADELFRKDYMIREKVLGADHPYTILSLIDTPGMDTKFSIDEKARKYSMIRTSTNMRNIFDENNQILRALDEDIRMCRDPIREVIVKDDAFRNFIADINEEQDTDNKKKDT